MLIKTRVIPCLLLRDKGLVKTIRFKSPKYVGDPINAVKIFNDKEVDELIFLDIDASAKKRKPNFELLSKIAGECFMPLCYGGGVRSIGDIKALFNIGIEKVAVNTHAVEEREFISEAARYFGSQSIVVSMDARKRSFGRYEVFVNNGQKGTGLEAVEYAKEMENLGAGELMLNSIDNDGAMLGYDVELVKKVSDAVRIPVIACGGAGNIRDLVNIIRNAGASAAAAGSMFVFQGPHRAVMISYPDRKDLQEVYAKVDGNDE